MKRIVIVSLFVLAIIFTMDSNAQEKGLRKIKFHGDVRFRSELDRNSKRIDGSERNDRDRLRYRMRFGFKYVLTKNIEFGGRIRSGNPMNQQSPHVTLGKEFHSDAFSIDKAYLKVKLNKSFWAWAGKNGMPFWKQNELLWDGDVNPEGLTLGSSFAIGENAELTSVLGYFITDHSGKNFGDDSALTLAQVKYRNKLGEDSFVFSTGIINGKDIPNKPDGTGTFFMEYNIWASSLQFNLKKAGFTFGLDFFKNLEDYKNKEDIEDVYKDQTIGYVGSVKFATKKFQWGYYYAHIEKYAVIDFLAQDDWLRWGNRDYTRSSNFAGHEFRMKYKIAENFNMVWRAYFIEGLETTGVNLETGTRVRLDFNIKF